MATIEQLKAKYCLDEEFFGKFDPKAPLKILKIETSRQKDGVSGSITFGKGDKSRTAKFYVFKSGNFDKKAPFYGYNNLSYNEQKVLEKAVLDKVSALGIKAK